MQAPAMWLLPKQARRGALLACLAAPWLLLSSPGPSPQVVPWLASAVLVLLAYLLANSASLPRRQLLLVVGVVAFVVLRPATGALDRAAFAGAACLILLAQAVARGSGPDGEPLVPLLAWAWLLAALASCAIALLQYFDLAARFSPWMYPASAGEAMGNLRQPNQLASLTTIGLAALLFLASRQESRLVRWLPAVVLLAAANAASASRTGLLQWMLLLALAMLWRAPNRGRNLLLCTAALAAYGCSSLWLPVLMEQVTGVTPETMLGRITAELGCSSRKVLWGNVLQLVAKHPWLGWGWGELDYAHYMHLYGDGPRFCDILDNAHNLPLHLAVELGVPFALLATGLAVALLLRGRPWKAPDPQRQLPWAVLMVLGTHSLLEYPLWYGPFQIALGLALGLLAAQATDLPSRPVTLQVRGAVVAAGLALAAYAGWDYARVSQLYMEADQRMSWWRDDTLGHAQKSWLFAGQAQFAALTMVPLTRENAAWYDANAQALLHYSPEPRIIERAIEAATMQQRLDAALLHLARYRAAFAQDYQTWRAEQNR
jgi:O-antigen ligase